MIVQTMQHILGKNIGRELRISYLEIYKERVYDLLAVNPTATDLPIREDVDHNILVPDLVAIPIRSMGQFSELWARGVANRRTAATRLNAHSSRSHSCLIIHISGANPAKLHLIDLAGSEDNRKTANAGERLAESGAINKSLFVLGQVVDALNSGALRVPYRDSKLTRLLQDSLGGRAYALIVANVAPTTDFIVETNNTLMFASKTRQVENNPVLARDIKRSVDNVEALVDGKGKRIKSSSPSTISPPIINKARKKESNPFDGQVIGIGLKKLISENITKEQVARTLREITRGTLLSPLLKGDMSALQQQTLKGKNTTRSPLSKVPKKARARKIEEFSMDPQVSQLLPLVEPELLRIINYGTEREIRELSEIGKKRAEAIVGYRRDRPDGEVHTLAELVESGIISNKVMSKIIVSNALEQVDFVQKDYQPEKRSCIIDDYNTLSINRQVMTMTKRVNPIAIATSEADSCFANDSTL